MFSTCQWSFVEHRGKPSPLEFIVFIKTIFKCLFEYGPVFASYKK